MNFKKWTGNQGNWLGEQHRIVAAFKGRKYLKWCAVQQVKNSWVSEYREQVGVTSKICPWLHFTGPYVLSFPNNSTYFQPNIRVKICEKVWEEVRWNCRNWNILLRSHFLSLCPWKVWDKIIVFSLQDFIVP